MLVQRLREIQEAHGFLPDDDLKALATETDTPLYRLQELASFFPHFRQEWQPPPAVEVRVCRDMTCHLRGAAGIIADLQKIDRTAAGGAIHVEGTSCLGRCDRAPAMTITRHADGEHHEELYAGHAAKNCVNILEAVAAGSPPPADFDETHDIDRSSWQIDYYAGKSPDERYSVVKQLLTTTALVTRSDAGGSPHPWMDVLKNSGLLGMGGAGAPAAVKWMDVWKAGGDEKYIVANGDESEPGTFKDRELLLHLPHLVIEGVILAGLLTNASAGYIYIRHEYHEQIEACRAEIQRAVSIGACGPNVFNTGRAFPVSVFVSPGGYVCGEQSALIEAMEDRRSQPRNRPPELATNGLRDKPTLVNNVETLSWAPAVFGRGAAWYSGQGVGGCKGRRFFSLSGDVKNPGVFEVPIGTPLGDLIALAGGMLGDRPLKAVATSGPSGGFLPARLRAAPGWEARLKAKLADIADAGQRDILNAIVAKNLSATPPAGSGSVSSMNSMSSMSEFSTPTSPSTPSHPGVGGLDILTLPLDLNVFRNLPPVLGLRTDVMLGAGLVVYADGTDMLDHARNLTEFYRNESCGKCVPCRIGSEKLVQIGTDLLQRRAGPGVPYQTLREIRRDVLELSRAMSLTSICGLGQVAPNPLASALEYFAHEIATANSPLSFSGAASLVDINL